VTSGKSGLTIRLVRGGAEECVLAVSGELSQYSVGLLRGRLSKALADTGRVLVDVSELRVTWKPAMQVFASTLARTGGWPGTRLVLFGAGVDLVRTMTALCVNRTVPVAEDEVAALLLLDRRPAIVVRTLDLERDLSAPRRARLFAAAACAEWGLDTIRDDAVVVVSELVENAVRHAAPAAGWRCGIGCTG
jgi:hypothetical protein